jgi:hypothetical protein
VDLCRLVNDQCRFLAESLISLAAALQERGSSLCVRVGRPQEALGKLLKGLPPDCTAVTLYYHCEAGPDAVRTEAETVAAFKAATNDLGKFHNQQFLQLLAWILLPCNPAKLTPKTMLSAHICPGSQSFTHLHVVQAIIYSSLIPVGKILLMFNVPHVNSHNARVNGCRNVTMFPFYRYCGVAW